MRDVPTKGRASACAKWIFGGDELQLDERRVALVVGTRRWRAGVFCGSEISEFHIRWTDGSEHCHGGLQSEESIDKWL